jgi:hypothetical protein
MSTPDTERLRELAAAGGARPATQTPDPPDDGAPTPLEAYADEPAAQSLNLAEPLPCARALVASEYTVESEPALMYWQDEFLQFCAGVWLAIPTSEVTAAIYAFLDREEQHPARRRVLDVLDALKAAVFLNPRTQPPCWLDAPERSASDLLICRNGIFDLTSGTRSPLTPKLFSRVTLPVGRSRRA